MNEIKCATCIDKVNKMFAILYSEFTDKFELESFLFSPSVLGGLLSAVEPERLPWSV